MPLAHTVKFAPGRALAVGSIVALCLLVFRTSAPAQEPLREQVDQKIAAGWQAHQLTPASPCDDATFLRRVYLDLCGTIPAWTEARDFLDDAASDKRAKLIARLLADPRYAQHQADVWDMLFFGRRPPGYYASQRTGFQRWLREAFERNMPYDQLARAMLTADGNTLEQGPPMFLIQYQNQPEDATEKVTQTFLGIQLQCARCHDHPFEPWKQLDFYGMAAFLARLQVVELGDREGKKLIALGETNLGEVKFTGPAAQAAPGKTAVPVKPKYLAGDPLEEPTLPADFKEEQFKNGQPPPPPMFSRKNALAQWVTRPENPYFARAAVNRIWAQYMGRGLVHPVDNMSPANAPSHPELLDEITRQFVAHNFDLKWLTSELVSSRSYQLSGTGPIEAERPEWFARARTRPLSAEELVDSWRVAVDYAAVDHKTAESLGKGERYYPLGEYQTMFFGQPADGRGNFLGGIHEQLYMSNGGIDRLFNQGPGGLLHALVTSEEPWEARVERLFLATLSRRPSAEETTRFIEYLSVDDKQKIPPNLQDALWALLTCSEFRFNH